MKQLSIIPLPGVGRSRVEPRREPVAREPEILPAPKCAQCKVFMRLEYRPLGGGRRLKVYRCSICRLAERAMP